MIKNIDIYSEMNKNYKLDKENKITGYASIDKPWQKYYSREAITKEIPELTAYQYMVSENQDNLNTKAIEYYGKKITYKNFIDMIDETSRRLYNLGIIEGEVVTVISVANPEFEILFYALNKLGAIINPIDVRSDYKQIKKYLMEVKSSTVVVMDNFLPEFDKCMEDEDIDNIVENIITLSPYNSVLFPFNVLAEKKSRKEDSTLYSKIDEIKKKNKYMTWNDLMNVPKYRYSRYPRYKKNMVAALVHTGGTTGTPKTVKLSNENFNAMVLQFQAFNTYIKADTFLNDIVPFVAYGILGAIHMPLCLGLTNIIAPILSPQEFTEFMIKYKPNNVLAVPTYWENYKNDERVKKSNLSFLKHPGSGGDSMNIKTEEEHNKFFKEHNSNAVIELGYGLTEVGSAAVACVGNINKLGSVGIPLVKNNVGIFEPGTEDELKYYEEGEIYIESPTTMLGYLNNIEEERKVLKAHKDNTKWIHTGDLGYMDEDGFIYVTGRIKRMIISGGFKIYPSEIEKVIFENKAVENCCIIAIDDDTYGSIPEAHIILKEEYKMQEEIIKKEINTECLKKLPSYAVPVNYLFRNSFPLTTVGKIDYKKLEEESNQKVKTLVRKK